MTPSFALSLSSEGVALLRRQPAGWALVAEAAFDAGDLDASVADLRARAEALSPEGRKVLLVIPNDQIRFLDVADPGDDAETREALIRETLDGATPYDIDDLAYDWTASYGRLLAAAAAWETLQEAEAFAVLHGFEPAAFVATAPQGAFIGSVDFGRAASWQGPAPERLARAIHVIPADDAALRPEPRPIPPAPRAGEPAEAAPDPIGILDPAPEPGQPAAAPPATDPAGAAPEGTPVPPAAAPSGPAPSDVAPSEPAPADSAPVEAAAPDAPPSGPAPADVPADPAPTPAPETPASATPPRVTLPHDLAEPPLRADAAPLTRPTGPTGDRATDPAPAVPMSPAAPASEALRPEPTSSSDSLRRRFTPIPQPDQSLREARVTEGTLDGDTPAPAAATPPRRALSFLSRRDAGRDKDRDDTPAEGALGKLRTRRRRAPGKKTAAKASPALSAAAAPDGTAAETPPAEAPGTAPTPPTTGTRTPTFTIPGTGTDAGADRPAPEQPPASAIRATATGPASLSREQELERMTLFGARGRERDRRPPLPMGLVATAAGIVAVAALAGWASVRLDDTISRLFGGGDPAVAALTAPEAVDTPTPTAAPAPTADDPELQPEPEETAPAAQSETAAAPAATRRLSQDEAAATYAATGIWQRGPNGPLEPAPTLLGDVYVASIDPDVTQQDAVALPATDGLVQEAALPDPGLTPPPGVVYDLDDRGLVRPSPDGTRAPAGHNVFTGPPPVVPPQRESALEPPAENTTPDSDAAEAAPALDQRRPEARPDDLVESRERAQLGGLSREELAEIRPVLRPVTAQEEAAAADPAAEATEQAIGASLVPVGRPRNMAAIVEEADSASVRQAAAPVPQTVTPEIPSSTNVAREATVTNALNLRETNLIGVYGTQDNRRALVRLPNGSYQKVQVGDRIDGGRVAAIGEAELRYVKGGRNITLNMPRG